MNMLRFKNIKGENFLSYKNVELNYENQGLTLIEGINNTNDNFSSNASGKSGLLSLLTYALYGRVGYSLGADDIINRDVGKNTAVILEFEKDGEPYRIERYRKHTKHKNKVILYHKDIDISAKSAKDTNDKIIEIIGFPYEVYTNSIMYGQGDNVVFSQATDKGKKEILENITNLAIYNKAQEIAKEKVKEKEINLADNERQKVNITNQLETIQRMTQQEQENYQYVAKQIEEVTEKYNLLSKQSTTHTYEQESEALNNELNTLLSEERVPFTPYTGTLDKFKTKKELLQDKYNEYASQMQVYELQKKKVIADQSNLNTLTTCPTCGHDLDTQHAELEYDRLAQEVITLDQQIAQYSEVLFNKIAPMIAEIEGDIDAEQMAIDNQRSQHEEKYREHDVWINNLRMAINNKESEKTNLQYQFTTLENELQRLNNLPKPTDYTEEIASLQTNLKELKAENDLLFISKENYDKAVKAFSREGIQSMVLDMVVPFLNKQANKYLTRLSGSVIEVNFTTQIRNKSGELRDKFEIEVNNLEGGETYLANSQGEKKRIDVAISLALQDLVMSNANLKTNVVFYDEIFEALDDKSSVAVVELLKDKAKEIESVFVITHNDALKTLFDNVLTVTKVDGESKIIEK